MDNYPEWQQYKIYEGHIKRLRDINRNSLTARNPKSHRIRSTLCRYKTSTDHIDIDNNEKEVEKELVVNQDKRERTNSPTRKMGRNSHMRTKTQMLRSPIPLVSQKEGKLIKSALNAKNITLKQKQQLLQNYLLSKRILQTKAVIKQDELKREYKFYRKVSQNMSKSKQFSNYSQQRSENYKKYERQKTNGCQFGEGKNKITLRIKDILLIKAVLFKNAEVVYTLSIHVGKNNYEMRALSFHDLFNKKIIINFKKSILIKHPEITIFLSFMRENFEQQIGSFKPNINNFETEKVKIYKITKGKFPVGTVQIMGELQYANKNLMLQKTSQIAKKINFDIQ